MINNIFKNTDIGKIPIEWDIKRMSDIFYVQHGVSLTPTRREKQSNYPMLRTLNVLWGRITTEKLDSSWFSEHEIKTLTPKLGDLFVCEGGDIGRTAMWEDDIGEIGYQNHLHRLRKKHDNIHPLFYAYWMQFAILLRKLYIDQANKTTIPNLSQSRLMRLNVACPPFEEQKRIAYILSKLQNAIKIQEKQIEILNQLKGVLMHRLFTEGIGHTEFKDTELGLVPKAWRLVKLSEATQGYKTVNSSNFKTGKFRYIDVSSISREYLSIDSYKELDVSEAPSRARKIVREGDVIFATVRPSLRRVAMIPKELDGEICSTAFCVLRSNQELVLPDYLFSYVSNDYFVRAVSAKEKGATYPAITDSDILERRIPLPEFSEQRDIANFHRTILSRLLIERERAFNLRGLFNTMLSKLMSGQIRTKDLVMH